MPLDGCSHWCSKELETGITVRYTHSSVAAIAGLGGVLPTKLVMNPSDTFHDMRLAAPGGGTEGILNEGILEPKHSRETVH